MCTDIAEEPAFTVVRLHEKAAHKIIELRHTTAEARTWIG
jgi:hypothetical protein